jgi:spoIIIJ-associated protein
LSDEALPQKPQERVQALLEGVVEALDLEASVSVTESDDEIAGVIEGDELGLLIGRHGQTIDALQLLCYRAAFQGSSERKRVSVDAAGYRVRRAELLHRDADQAVHRATTAGRPVRLEPMTASERKVIHDHLKDAPGVETYSEGEEPERCVVVAPHVAAE